MDCIERPEVITADRLKISEARFYRLIGMLVKNGYVENVTDITDLSCDYPVYDIRDMEITLKGLEYLTENTLMKKAAKMAKGIKDTIPGI